MARPPRPWIVTRHDPIEELDENLWAVNGDMPGFPRGCGMLRRMSIIKLADGRLVFHNAIPLDEASLARVRAWGKPAFLVAPIHLHTFDAHAFQEKLGLEVFTSQTKIAEVRAQIPNAKPLENFPADPTLQFQMLAGTRFGEPVNIVKSGPRASLLFCDVFQNNRPGTGLGGFMFKLMGFTGPEPRTPPLYKKRAISDKGALKQELLRLADTPGLARLVPSHGVIVSENPAEVLRTEIGRYL